MKALCIVVYIWKCEYILANWNLIEVVVFLVLWCRIRIGEYEIFWPKSPYLFTDQIRLVSIICKMLVFMGEWIFPSDLANLTIFFVSRWLPTYIASSTWHDENLVPTPSNNKPETWSQWQFTYHIYCFISKNSIASSFRLSYLISHVTAYPMTAELHSYNRKHPDQLFHHR